MAKDPVPVTVRGPNAPVAADAKVTSVPNPLVEESHVIHESIPGTALPSRTAARSIPNRISGPSFLGLSDAPQLPESDSSYLLVDDEVKESSSRGLLALLLLIVFGVLVFKQWSTVSGWAWNYAQQAGISGSGSQQGTQKSSGDNTRHSSDAASNSGMVSSDDNAAGKAGKDTDKSKTAAAKAPADNAETSKPENDRNESADAPASTPTQAGLGNDEMPAAARAQEKSVTKPLAVRKPVPAASTDANANRRNDAEVQAAESYLYGRGVPQDCGRALSLLHSAAARANPKAAVKLGALYSTGQCVAQNRSLGYHWFSQAQKMEPANGWLQRSMNSLWANMSPEERRRAEIM